ncbi:MAG TPA: LytR family transcriptional regulator [Proteiniclasticum sp.]|uniref:LCP family protein n=1 Tax=Proteiniclasticum sp. TaxID=2053595 RepID=UPI000E948FCF|nr:LCP family protein [Proteiniclasticum sp.]HBW13328.1 LytR family transcriptional regulator [Proteiniclasticum sp.]
MDTEVEVNLSKGKNKRKRHKKLKITILILLGLLLSAIGIAYTFFQNTYNKVSYVDIPKENEELGIEEEEEEIVNIFKENKAIINILLMGIDKRDQYDPGRSDAMMILSIDPISNSIKLSSIMRDSLVEIKGHGEDKLNHAYAFGGPELALHTINKNYKMNIKYFASIDYSGLTNIIDSIGGIYAQVKEEEIDMINKYTNDVAYVNGTDFSMITKPGYQLLDGTQAVAYARIRKVGDGDYERTQRQRIVLSGIIRKLTTLNILELPGTIQKLAPNVETNITSSYMLKVGTSVLNTGMKEIKQARFPLDEDSEGEMINGIWYLVFDKYKTVDALHNFIFRN